MKAHTRYLAMSLIALAVAVLVLMTRPAHGTQASAGAQAAQADRVIVPMFSSPMAGPRGSNAA